MTLKEKFKEILTAFWISNWEDECEKIAEDFAIGFAEWLLNERTGFNRETEIINRLFHERSNRN